MILGAMLEAGTVLTVVTVASTYDLLKEAMMEHLSLPSLRDPQKMEGVSTFVRVMLGEVRLSTDEEE
eukprot:1394635-Prorocentrum_lima.AAC.1